MKATLQNCAEYNDNRRICTAEQNRKKYILNNHSGHKVQKVKIDGCLESNGPICDYLFIVSAGPKKKAIFIELKGRKINDAVKQIISTLEHLKNEIRDSQLAARIIGQGTVPGVNRTPAYIKLFGITGGDLIIRTNECEDHC